MNQTAVPRPLVLVGLPVLAAAIGGAIWGWLRFGDGIWFDTLTRGLALCL